MDFSFSSNFRSDQESSILSVQAVSAGRTGRSSYVKLNEKDKKYFEAIQSTFFT